MISRKSYRRLKLRLHDIFLGFKIAAAIFAVALALLNAIYATVYKRIRMLNPMANTQFTPKKVKNRDLCLICSHRNCVIDMGDGLKIPCVNLVDDEEKGGR